MGVYEPVTYAERRAARMAREEARQRAHANTVRRPLTPLDSNIIDAEWEPVHAAIKDIEDKRKGD